MNHFAFESILKRSFSVPTFPELLLFSPAMFSSGANYNKLKTNLRLCINRLKLLEKKKSEMAMKSRKVRFGNL